MKIERPQFELTRVFADGTSGAPEIIRVGCMPWDTRMARRGFLGVGVGVASVLLLLDGEATGQVTPSTRNQTNNVPMKAPDKVINAHRDRVHALAISPDGKVLASGSDDNTIKLWSWPACKLLATLKGHKFDVRALAISPDGMILVSGSQDQTIKFWSLPGGTLLATLEGDKDKDHFCALAISPDGKILASGAADLADQGIKLWSLPGGKLLAAFEEHKPWVKALAISPDGKILASGSHDKTLKLWSLPEAKLIATLDGHSDSVTALAISPDGKILASGSDDKTIKLWSLPEAKLIASLDGHSNYVKALAISPNGKILASGSWDDTINLWSLPDGKLIATLDGPKRKVEALAISPDGKTLASGHLTGVVVLWDFEKRSFRSFLFDPDASETDGISYNIYDRITGTTITFTLPCGSQIPPGAVCTCNCVPGTYRLPSSGGGGYPSGGGTICTCNKVCTCIPVPSDRGVKEAFETTDPLLILQKLSELPIQSWNYKGNNSSIRHIGPMAQDFAAAFAVGEDDKHISPVDAQGVAFAAIQGLYQIIVEKEASFESLQAELRHQQEKNETLSARIETLERLVKDAAVSRGCRARI
jgi:WD40 repeat protein